jgi:hypothetical protein
VASGLLRERAVQLLAALDLTVPLAGPADVAA